MANAKQTAPQLTSWLKLNRLISQKRTTDQVLKDALRDIIPSLSAGCMKDIFFFISNHAKHENDKLKLIHQSISKRIIKYEDQNDATNTENKTENHGNIFDVISNESISNICSYLEKTDINILKLTDRRNGIICLEEMNKFMVAVITRNVCGYKKYSQH